MLRAGRTWPAPRSPPATARTRRGSRIRTVVEGERHMPRITNSRQRRGKTANRPQGTERWGEIRRHEGCARHAHPERDRSHDCGSVWTVSQVVGRSGGTANSEPARRSWWLDQAPPRALRLPNVAARRTRRSSQDRRADGAPPRSERARPTPRDPTRRRSSGRGRGCIDTSPPGPRPPVLPYSSARPRCADEVGGAQQSRHVSTSRAGYRSGAWRDGGAPGVAATHHNGNNQVGRR